MSKMHVFLLFFFHRNIAFITTTTWTLIFLFQFARNIEREMEPKILQNSGGTGNYGYEEEEEENNDDGGVNALNNDNEETHDNKASSSSQNA